MTSKEAWEILQKLPPSWSYDAHLIEEPTAGVLYGNGLIQLFVDMPSILSFKTLTWRCRRSEKGDLAMEDPFSITWDENKVELPDETYQIGRRIVLDVLKPGEGMQYE